MSQADPQSSPAAGTPAGVPPPAAAGSARGPAARPRPAVAAHSSRRIATLVGCLALVLVLMQLARDPARWRWLWAIEPHHPADSPPSASDGSSTPAATGKIAPDRLATSAGNPQTLAVRWPGEQLPKVRDDVGFRADDRVALLALLQWLEHQSNQQLDERAWGDADYPQMMRQSEALRGKVLRLGGTVHRAHWVPLPENPRGLARYAELWLTSEGGPELPLVVYCLELPEGFPLGMQIRETVRLPAVFFKRWPYAAGDGLRTAPLLVAKAPQWQPRTAAAAPANSASRFVFHATMTLLLLGIALVGRSRRLSRRRAAIEGNRASFVRRSRTPPPSHSQIAAGLAALEREPPATANPDST